MLGGAVQQQEVAEGLGWVAAGGEQMMQLAEAARSVLL